MSSVCLGLLYHLDAPESFSLLENVSATSAARLLVVDTLREPRTAEIAAHHAGRAYHGERVREHGDADSPAVRKATAAAVDRYDVRVPLHA